MKFINLMQPYFLCLGVFACNLREVFSALVKCVWGFFACGSLIKLLRLQIILYAPLLQDYYFFNESSTSHRRNINEKSMKHQCFKDKHNNVCIRIINVCIGIINVSSKLHQCRIVVFLMSRPVFFDNINESSMLPMCSRLESKSLASFLLPPKVFCFSVLVRNRQLATLKPVRAY